MKKILFTGGGSAGHVVPNLAVMRELRYAYDLCYVGTGGIEERLVSDAGYSFFRVDTPKLRRSLSLKNLTIPLDLQRARKAALQLLRREKPDLVFSKGGYASYPAAYAASKLGIPLLTHESDLSAGLCTKLIAKRCRFVLTSFPETAKAFPNGKYVGSPVRKELLYGDKLRARHKFGFSPDSTVLLVFGGGSGSKLINEAVYHALPTLLNQFSVLHICGKDEKFYREQAPRQTAGRYLAVSYEADMASAYAASDLVLCRAGSNTVFELVALKKPALLVPLARGSRGDQIENAQYFEERGLVRVLSESDLSALPDALIEAYHDETLRQALKNSNFSSGTGEIVRIIKEIVENGQRSGANG